MPQAFFYAAILNSGLVTLRPPPTPNRTVICPAGLPCALCASEKHSCTPEHSAARCVCIGGAGGGNFSDGGRVRVCAKGEGKVREPTSET